MMWPVLLSVIAAAPSAGAMWQVVPHLTVNVDDATRHEIAGGVARILSERFAVTATVSPARPPPDCAARLECASALARDAGADGVLFLVLVRLGDAIQLEGVAVRDGRSQPLRPLRWPVEPAGRTAIVGHWLQTAEPVLPRRPLRADPETAEARPAASLVAASQSDGGPSGVPWGPVVLGGAGVLVAVTGGIVGGVAQADFDALVDDGCETRVCEPDRIDDVRRQSVAADVLMVTGAAMAVGALVWFFLDEPAAAAAVAPTDGGAAVRIGGRF